VAGADQAPGVPVRVADAPDAAVPSKAQATFYRLIDRIGVLRESLARWQAFVPAFDQRVVAELEPMRRRGAQARMALARLFDAAHDGADCTRRERAKLAVLVLDLCGELLQDGADAEPEVIALHDKYSAASHAQMKEQETGFLRDLAETVFGVELDASDHGGSPEAIREAMQRKLREPQDAEPRRPDSARELARQARVAADAQAAAFSVREVYRKLASALHPDREADETERARKTALMQQVNQAYAATDLLRLLELQIQAEQIDAAALGSLSARRLRHYNQVLAEQCAQLEHEIDALVSPLIHLTGSVRTLDLTPQTVSRGLDGDVAMLRRDALRAEHDLKRLADRRALRAWLRGIKLSRYRDESSYDELFDAFEHTR
jgi:hypothetical protein